MTADIGLEADRGSTEDEIVSVATQDSADVSEKPPRLRGYGVIVVVLICLLVAGAALIEVSDEARRQFALSFVPKPERYTELYFPEQRPVEVMGGLAGESLRVQFTIANHEGQTRTLRYTARVVDGAEVALGAATGSAEIGDTGVATITSTIPLPLAAPWSAVEITLDGRPERIRYLRDQADAMAR